MHQQVIDEFRSRIKELQESEDRASENAMDMQRMSQNEETDKFITHLANQLNIASARMATLYDLRSDNIEHTEAAPGAVIETNQGTFYVSAGIQKFNLDHHEITPLSPDSPLFKSMSGKRKGEKFNYKKTNYTIKEVY